MQSCSSIKSHRVNEISEIVSIKILSETYRKYHNISHVDYILNKCFALDSKLFALFHDAVYDPSSSTNEEDSVKYMRSYIDIIDKRLADRVAELIMLSKHTYNHYTELSDIDWSIIKLDLGVFLDPSTSIYNTELDVFKEYQSYDWSVYKKGRIEVLLSFKEKLKGLDTNIDQRISFINEWTPKIGVFAGSFNPFHIGHNNILQKAENVFDKVIVAFGHNKQKPNEEVTIPNLLKYHQVDRYDGLLMDYIKDKNYHVTLIRGLRNGADLSYEQNLANVMRDINYDTPLNVVYLTCDKEFEYISSSIVRELKSLGISKYEAS